MTPLLLLISLISAPSAEPYRAQGSDPSWSLAIADGKITYQADGGAPVTVSSPRPEDDEGILYYRAGDLAFQVMPMACTDRTTGLRYADSVFLQLAGKQYGGCGGAPLPADSLDGTSWYFAEIGGEATKLTGDIFKDDRYALDFGRDRFVGYSGCNRIGGRYRVADGVMTIEEFGSTGGGCGAPYSRLEQLAWRILGGPMKVSRPAPDILQLAGEGGTIRLRRSAESD